MPSLRFADHSPVTFRKFGSEESVSAAQRNPCGQLMGSIRGLLSVEDSEARWVVPATHGIWIPPGLPHALRSHGNFQGWLVSVEAAACASLPAVPRILSSGGLLREAVSRALVWDHTPHTTAQQNLIAVVLDEIVTLPHENLGVVLPQTTELLRIANGILSDLKNCRTLEAWARWGHISVRNLSRRFVLETGFTFTRWRQQAKLLRALEMLAEDLPVTTISLELGYTNVSAFIALFRQTFGVTPARYAPDQNVYEGKCMVHHKETSKATSMSPSR